MYVNIKHIFSVKSACMYSLKQALLLTGSLQDPQNISKPKTERIADSCHGGQAGSSLYMHKAASRLGGRLGRATNGAVKYGLGTCGFSSQ